MSQGVNRSILAILSTGGDVWRGKLRHNQHISPRLDPAGNPVAAIVSPVVSVVVLALLGAGVSYFRSGRGGCLRSSRRGKPRPGLPTGSRPSCQSCGRRGGTSTACCLLKLLPDLLRCGGRIVTSLEGLLMGIPCLVRLLLSPTSHFTALHFLIHFPFPHSP